VYTMEGDYCSSGVVIIYNNMTYVYVHMRCTKRFLAILRAYSILSPVGRGLIIMMWIYNDIQCGSNRSSTKYLDFMWLSLSTILHLIDYLTVFEFI